MGTGSPSTVGDAIIAQLAAAGVRRVYGLIGDAVFPLADALARQDTVQFIMTTHEQHAAFMASAEAKLTGKPAACIASAGPGATNLATGLAEAHFDGAPVIAVTGQVETSKFGTGAKQYFDQQRFFRPVVDSTELALSGDAALHALTAAISRAILHGQVTHLSVPKDVLTQPVTWEPLPVGGPPSQSKGESEHVRGDGPRIVIGDWDKAVKTVHAARRPLLLLGTAEQPAASEARNLARTLGAAVVAAQHAKGAVPFSDEHLIGGIGEAHVPPMMEKADLIILVGSPGYEEPFLPPKAPVIALDRTVRPLPGHTVLAFAAGPLVTMVKALHRAISQRTPDEAWRQEIAKARGELERQKEDVSADDSSPVNPYRAALLLQQAVARDAIITLDIGSFTHWFDLGFRNEEHTVLISPTWRAVGSGLPAAIAARLAYPHRQVVALVGDGGLMASLGELATAVHYRLPIVIVVMRNDAYDIEAQKMASQGFTQYGTRPAQIDFVAYARACGAQARSVPSAAELPGALKDALKRAAGESQQPVLLDVSTGTPALPHLG